MATIKPLNDKILIKRAKAQTSKGGILLPESAQEKPREGEVLAVGPGKYDDSGRQEPLNVKPGDRVIFSSYAGTEVETEDKNNEYLIVAERDILGIVS